ncbi:TPA: MFS transporter [Bacillus thuringiensis]|uniref:MFS transporter n=12 Tax=Bacillus cereus group TaxID=86661 RepID=A0A9X6QA81_BACTU|nr:MULTISPECIES: MFS transporter [Bacillus]ANN35208.1 MFS transporter [Bacillus thuringiensis serovar coreanensis]MBJ6722155.1 MFS transporter [Bacillus sp. PR5]MCU7392642.1 MFS transporter [Bacillus sp. ST24]MCX2702954.1 MFS transporter [Bacillus sp. AS_5]MEB4840044.1 MFS transporter [Paenibacillus jamilae]OUB36031.1 MFS transporter [Bacillus thuringiensis serovar yunnanensis]QQP79763.1 MFS transporter [Bacillus sp. TK-2]CGG49661.1 major facilitator family protein [Streptococcus pneumoniae
MGKVKEISKRKLLGIAGLGWLFDAMDVGMLSFVMVALQKDWGLSTQEMGWIGSINSIGMAVGALIFGILSDKIGRKSVFIITLLLFSIGSGLTALTTTLAMFLVLRFLIGMGLGGELPVASTLVSESVEAHERGKIVVLLESFWAGGWLIAALISYFVIPKYGWEVAMVLSAVPALYALYLRWNLPDSPRFQKVEKRPSVIENIKSVWSGEYRKATIMLWILWFCVVFSYYGMFLWLPSVMVLKGFSLIKSFQYVLIMTLAQLPGYFTAAWFIERLGRKFVLVTYLIGTACSAYLFGVADSLTVLIVAGMLLSFFNLGAWGALYAYTPEQYPTVIRGTGAGMAAAFGRIGGILGPLLVGYLVASEASLSLIFTIFCGSILIGVFAVIILGQETKQRELV